MLPQAVLIVDDEEDILDILESLLEPLDLIIEKASDGQQAYEKTMSGPNKYDLIISDLNMPNMDGLTFLEKIRSQGVQTPLIFATGYGDRQKVYRAWKLGANDFLDKPFKEELLLQAVKSALALNSINQNMLQEKVQLEISKFHFEKIEKIAKTKKMKVSELIQNWIDEN